MSLNIDKRFRLIFTLLVGMSESASQQRSGVFSRTDEKVVVWAPGPGVLPESRGDGVRSSSLSSAGPSAALKVQNVQMCGAVKLAPGLEFDNIWTRGVASPFSAQGREHWVGHPMAQLPSSTSLTLGHRDSF
ncbi:serine/arginine repetitive matrix protein 2-like protein [Lates japonicus]|uniref:Serine/arginine repetitive matrix protein 2-like protein n=1 Tax=Lates japonicus TaxID=270547 RepID=A0AAD3NNA5_LATJO|nr:serine/arginine repetitive matrix protein 2-like protein [Lates japonicus]